MTAVVPATPSNIGVFQLAVISVLHTGFGVSTADALAYGVILQAVEVATAVALGLPALVREGMTWGDLRTAGALRRSGPPAAEAPGARSCQPAIADLALRRFPAAVSPVLPRVAAVVASPRRPEELSEMPEIRLRAT